MEVVRERLHHRFSAPFAQTVAARHDVKVAVIYDKLFPDGLPAGWVRGGSWKIPNNVICGSDEVVFYAVGPSERQALTEHLREFSKSLPSDVVQTGY